jgi:CubicO group peptidase (beta-lactamase class C family)
MNRIVRCLAVVAISVSILHAQQAAVRRLDGSTISPQEIDQTMTRLLKAAEVTGAAIAILDHGKVAYLKAYGFRDKEKNLPLTVDSVMSAASISKSAFGYLVMELVEKGQIDLDKPVYQYLPKPLPDYPKYADLAGDERYKKITARMLLSHTSGFPNWRAFEDDRKLHIHFEPGSRFAYSGEGIDLLQLEVETVTGKPLEDLMQERVFQPMGMTRTSMLWQARFESDFANGYDDYERSVGPHRWNRADAAGSMLITISDLAKFVQGVMQGKELREKTREEIIRPQIQILSKHEFPSLNTETTEENKAVRLSYGLGWGLYWSPYGEVFFKEGHDEGWRNYAVVFDKSKSGMAILTNSSNGEGIFKEVLETVLRDTFTPIEWEGYTPYDKLPPRPPLKQHKRVTVESMVLDRYVGKYAVDANIVLTVRREGDHLLLQENDEPAQELQPESEVDFYSVTSDDSLTFQKTTEGKVTGMTLHVDGRDIPVKRMD